MSRRLSLKAVVFATTAFFSHLLGLAVLLRSVKFSPAGKTLPLLTGDYALYFARALRTAAMEATTSRGWGYDPFSMAGYPFNTVHETGSLLFSLLAAHAAPLMDPGSALLIIEVCCLALVPVPMFVFVRRLAGEAAACTALGLTVLMFGRFGIASVSPWLHGFLPFHLGCFLALWQVSVLWTWLEDRDPFSFGVFAALAAIIPLLHPGAALFSFLGVVFSLLSSGKLLRRVHFLGLGAAAVGALAVNWFWFQRFLRFRSWLSDTPNYIQPVSEALRHFMPARGSFVSVVSASFNFYICLAAGWGLLHLRKTSGLRFKTMLGWTLATAVIGFAGSQLRLGEAFGPGRYVVALELMVYALAGVGTARLLVESRGRATVGILAGVLLLAAAVSDVGDIRRGSRQLVNSFPEEQSGVIDWLGGPGRVDGRTLVECEAGNEPHYLDPLPLLTNAHVLGGTNAVNFLKSRFTIFSGVDFVDGRPAPGYHPNVFGKRLENFSQDEFESKLRLYNVRQVVAWSVAAKSRLNLMTRVLQAGEEFGGHQVFRARRPSGWLISGEGEVNAAYDHLRISGLSVGRSVLSYHWIDTLKVAPPVSIRPVRLPDSPLEFIEIDNPTGVSDVDIFNGGL